MLYEAHGISKFVLVCGYTDLRKGIPGLSQIIEGTYQMNPFEKNVLFLFCGRRGDRIKCLLWEDTGYLHWPRTPEEAVCISKNQFRLLLKGLNPVRPRVDTVEPKTSF